MGCGVQVCGDEDPRRRWCNRAGFEEAGHTPSGPPGHLPQQAGEGVRAPRTKMRASANTKAGEGARASGLRVFDRKEESAPAGQSRLSSRERLGKDRLQPLAQPRDPGLRGGPGPQGGSRGRRGPPASHALLDIETVPRVFTSSTPMRCGRIASPATVSRVGLGISTVRRSAGFSNRLENLRCQAGKYYIYL
jgi:hypothetical protein